MLEERFKSNKPEFIVIYGRRRVGKTELIKNFAKDKLNIYFLSDKRSDKEQLREIARKIGEFFNDDILITRGFEDWVQMFKYLKDKIKERIIFTIDEFPYLIAANKAIPSLFQKGWDEYLRETKIFLILCGSSIGMMERGVLSYKSPLYGRRTGQLFLDSLKFIDAQKFFTRYKLEQNIEAFAILGGIPAYLKQFDDSYSIEENIKKNILRKDSFLFNEPEFLLREELKEPKTYFSILKVISFGKTKLNEIATSLNMERNKVSMYLSVLENLKLIDRILPVTEKHPHKSRKGLYLIKDNFMRFWLRFVYPYKSELEMGELDNVLKNKIRPFFGQHVSFVFEDICKEFLVELNKRKRLPFSFEKIGKWWHKDKEIDLVALSSDTRQIAFFEVKWSELGLIDAKKLLEELKDKSKFVKWLNEKRREYFGLITKRIKNKEKLKRKGYLVFDLRDFTPVTPRI
ncbi:ATP-binding protein [Candidatus Bathyarchaeota archaeon]|nr:ATP-binding protein [Candidatus Bathyarchaeota archaeon]